MEPAAIVEILNELLAAEQRNLVTYLMDSTVFVSRLGMKELTLLEQMARDADDAGARLAEAIIALGGVPGLRTVDLAPADLHFQELHAALPRLAADRQALVDKYAIAGSRVGPEPVAAQVVGRIKERHADELARLTELLKRNVGSSA